MGCEDRTVGLPLVSLCQDFHHQHSKQPKTAVYYACKNVAIIHHVMEAVHEAMDLLNKPFQVYKSAFPSRQTRGLISPSFATLMTHTMPCAFCDKCVVKLPTGDNLSPQYGGVWKLETSSLILCPGCILALRRSVRDVKCKMQ